MERAPLKMNLILIIFLATTSCVSVRFPKNETQRSTVVQVAVPKPPFVEIPSKDIDRVWRNQKNGNTISYLSECNNPSDPSLQHIQRGILSEIQNQVKVESNSIEISSRAGLHTVIDTSVDGVPSRIELVIFKKNNCIYILTYAAVEKSYGENQKNFNSFVRGFAVP